MTVRLHHFTYYVSPGGSERKLIDQLGLAAGAAVPHAGQGTIGLPYHFRNSFLELAWLEDETPLAEPAAQQLHLRERARWPEHEGSPFVIALIRERAELPLPTRRMIAPGPQPMPIDVGDNVDRLDEPLVLVLPLGAGVPTPAAGERTQARVGLTAITCVELALPNEPSATLQALAATGLVRLRRGERSHAFVEADGGKRGQRVDLSPLLPIGFLV